MYRRIIILAIAMLAMTLAVAQEGLNIQRFFSDNYLSQPYVISVSVSGEKLKKWNCNLSLYRSVTVHDNADEAIAMERAVKKDGTQATSRTVSMADGHVYFGFYALPPMHNVNRYIIFLQSRDKESRDRTDGRRTDLFYLEGKATADDINEMLRSLKNAKQ